MSEKINHSDKSDIWKIISNSKKEEIKFLQELLRIPSPTGSEYEISRKIIEKFQENGFEVEEYFADTNRPNLRIQMNVLNI